MKIKFPEHIDLKYSSRYNLCVEVDVNGFSFTLSGDFPDPFTYEKIGKEIQKDAFVNFQSFFYENDFFTLPFNSLYIVNHTSRFTFIPSGIFEKKDSEKYIDFNFSPDNSKVLSQTIKHLNITILHCMRSDVYDFFMRSTVNPVFVHHLSSLITFFQGKPLMGGGSKMILDIRQDTMDVLCYSHGNFILGNQFSYRTVSDMVYYILFIWKQLKLNQTQDFIYILGSDQNAMLKSSLKEYVKHVVILDRMEIAPSGFPFSNLNK